MTMHLFRIEFARPRPSGDMQLMFIVAVDMTSAIAAAVQHRGDADYLGVSTCLRVTAIDAVATCVRTEIVRQQSTRPAEVLS